MSARADRNRVRNDAIRCMIGIGLVLAPFAAIGILGAIFIVFRILNPLPPCTIADDPALRSPDGAYDARLVYEDCPVGIGGDSITWTVVVSSKIDRSDRSDVFASGERPALMWTSNDRLRITAASSLGNGLTKSSSDDGRISIAYVYRISPTPETIAKFHAFCASNDPDREELTTWRGVRAGWYLFYRGECGRW